MGGKLAAIAQHLQPKGIFAQKVAHRFQNSLEEAGIEGLLQLAIGFEFRNVEIGGDRDRLLAVGAGDGDIAHLLVKLRQVVENGGFEVACSDRLGNGEGFAEAVAGFGVVFEGEITFAQVTENAGNFSAIAQFLRNG